MDVNKDLHFEIGFDVDGDKDRRIRLAQMVLDIVAKSNIERLELHSFTFEGNTDDWVLDDSSESNLKTLVVEDHVAGNSI